MCSSVSYLKLCQYEWPCEQYLICEMNYTPTNMMGSNNDGDVGNHNSYGLAQNTKTGSV